MLRAEQFDRATLRLPDGNFYSVQVVLHVGAGGQEFSGIILAPPEIISAAVASSGVAHLQMSTGLVLLVLLTTLAADRCSFIIVHQV